jgi:hypothetical protein
VSVTANVIVEQLSTYLNILPVFSSATDAFNWQIKSLVFNYHSYAGYPHFIAPQPVAARPALLAFRSYSGTTSWSSVVFEAFQRVQYPTDIGFAPYTATLGVTWEPVSPQVALGRPAIEKSTFETPSTISFSLSSAPIIRMTVTAAGLTIEEEQPPAQPGGQSQTRQATIIDGLGAGFYVSGLRANGQTVTVTANGFPPRSPWSPSPYLYLQIQGSGDGPYLSNCTLLGNGWTGTSDIGIDSGYAAELVLAVPHVGLTFSGESNDLTLRLGQTGTFLDQISCAALRIHSAGASDLYVKTLSARAITSSSDRVKVIAAAVSRLAFWSVDLTVRASLSLEPFPASTPAPVDLRHRNGALTVDEEATIDLSSTGRAFLNRSWFPGSRYYIKPSSIPATNSPSGSGWPGTSTTAPSLTALVCGVDCGKFEVLMKDYSWYRYEGSVYYPQTAKQTCVKYSDIYEISVANSDPNLMCVALRAVDRSRSSSTDLTYTEANTLGVSGYEYRTNALSSLTTSVSISGQTARQNDYYNSFPINVDFDAAPVHDVSLSFGAPPSDRVTLKASAGRLYSISLSGSSSSDATFTLAAAESTRPLSPKRLSLSEPWQLAPADVNWGGLQYVSLPFSYYRAATENVQRVPQQTISYVNDVLDLDGVTFTLGARSIGRTGGLTFNAPPSGAFRLELAFRGTGLCLDNPPPVSPSSCQKLDNVKGGTVSFGGTGPDPGGQYTLNFAGITSKLYLPVDTAMWTPPANLTISQPSSVAFNVAGGDQKTISFVLSYPNSISLECLTTPSCSYASKVEFTRMISASSLSIDRPTTLAVTLNELQLWGSAQTVPCTGPTCASITIKTAYLYGGTVLPGYKLTDDVWVMSSGTIDPEAFSADATYHLNEMSRLHFRGTVPSPPKIDAQYNLTRRAADEGRRTGSQIVRDRHNDSVFVEFDRSEPYSIRHICGNDFPDAICNEWKSSIQASMKVTGNDWGSGVQATASFECRDDPEPDYSSYPYSAYSISYGGSGGIANATIQAKSRCLYVDLKFTGGDPNAPHYSEPSAAGEGISSGTAAAIALGVILAVVIVAVVLLIVLGKLVFSHGSDAEP